MERNSITLESKLVRKLRKYISDEESLLGVLVYADTDEDRQALLDFIEHGDDVDYETITVFAIELDLQRNRT